MGECKYTAEKKKGNLRDFCDKFGASHGGEKEGVQRTILKRGKEKVTKVAVLSDVSNSCSGGELQGGEREKKKGQRPPCPGKREKKKTDGCMRRGKKKRNPVSYETKGRGKKKEWAFSPQREKKGKKKISHKGGKKATIYLRSGGFSLLRGRGEKTSAD